MKKGKTTQDDIFSDLENLHVRLQETAHRFHTGDVREKWGLSLGRLNIIYWFALLLVVAAGGYVYYIRTRYEANQRRVVRTTEVGQRLEALASALIRTEYARLGFASTGDDVHLENHQNARRDVSELLGALRQSSSADPTLAEGLEALQPVVSAELQLSNSSIELRRSNPTDTAAQMRQASEGALNITKARAILQQTEEGELRLLEQGRKASSSAAYRMMWILAVGTPLGILLMISATVGLSRESRARRQVDSAFRSCVEQFHLLSDAVKGQFVCLLDPEGYVTYWNKGSELLTGFSKVEVLGQKFSRLYTPQDVESGKLARDLAATEPKGRFALDTQLVRRDGSRFWANVVIAALRDGAGQLTGYSISAQDMQERKKTEDALRETTTALDALIQNLPVATFLLDLQDNVVIWSRSAERMLGWSEAEATGQLLPIIPADERDRFSTLSRRVLEDRTVRNRRIVLSRKDGSQLHVRMRIFPFRDAEGRIVGRMHFVAGDTKRTSAEEMFRRCEDYFRRMADHMPHIIWTAKPDGSLEFRNRAWFEYKGIGADQTNDSIWESLLHPEELESFLASWKAAVEAGRPFAACHRLRGAKEGEYRWHLGRAAPVRDEQSGIVRWIGTWTDIEDQRHDEEGLKAETDAIAREYVEKLEGADREIEALSSFVTQDIGRPLQTIERSSRILMDVHATGFRPEAKLHLQLINRNSLQIEELINELEYVLRLGKEAVRKQLVWPSEIVCECLESLGDEKSGRQIRISNDLPPCTTDPVMLKLIYMKLLSNAVRSTRRSESTIIEIGGRIDSGKQVYFVKHSGPASGDPSADGSARVVSLAAVHRVIRVVGGRFWQENADDEGATFCFALDGSQVQADEKSRSSATPRP